MKLLSVQGRAIWLWVLLVGFWAETMGQTPGWQWQNPLPTGNPLNDVQFLDTQTGWAVGYNGTILYTNNGGQTWQIQPSGTTRHIYSVHFTDAQNGWAVGYNGTILKTGNGGHSWQAQTSGTTQHIYSVHFTDAQSGWAVGDSGTNVKTSNGGQTWQTQTSITTEWLRSVHFTDAQTGWVVGNNGRILKTGNGGQSWQTQTSGTLNNLLAVHFTDVQTGWAVGDFGTILKTGNGGQTWQVQSSGTTYSLYSIHFTGVQTGWAVGQLGTVLKTNNGGQTWQVQTSGISNGLVCVHFANAQNGWVVGNGGTILKTSNSGQTWHAQSSGNTNYLSSVHFTDAQTGWVVGNNGTILKTGNGGQTWQAQTSGAINWIYSVHFTDAHTGWAVGNNGTILKTSNGGQTWQAQTSGTTDQHRSVYFTNAQTGWAVGGAGTILKTTNGGQTWQAQNSGTTNWLYSVHFTDAQTGWAVGDGGTILKTSDGGQAWQTQTSGTPTSLRSVHFTDVQTGLVVGYNGTILKTSNGGQTWQAQSSGTSNWLLSVHFTDAHTGWAVGASGTILKTSNAGQTWQIQPSGTTNTLYSVHFTDAQTGWVVGDAGTILHYQGGVSPELPSSFLLGKLFEKIGTDCSNTTVGVPYGVVKAEPGPYYGVAKLDGNYSLRVPVPETASSFSLNPVGFFNYAFQSTTVCPPSGLISVLLDTIPDTLANKDFGFEITPCHHLDVQIASNRRRRCFRNATTVSYVNQGSLAAPNANVLVAFPHWVRGISASAPYVAVNDSVWRFELGSVSPGTGGQIHITDSVICGFPDIRNLSQCTKATIFPAPDCPPPGGWSGADLVVSGRCVNNQARMVIRNQGQGNMADSTEYTVLMDSVLVKSGKVKLAAGDSLVLGVQPQNMAVTLSVVQVANHPANIFVSTTVEGCGYFPLSGPSATVNHFPKSQTPNSKTHCLPILDSYDPNDKQAFPIGFGASHTVKPGSEMEYLVRFQNTGNDTAYTVYVIDSLDNNLNPESFQIGAVSHPYELTMQTTKQGRTFLRWQFNNIMLADSFVNEPKSHGFIQYRITPKAGISLGSQARNKASIYFDFNPPVETNQTLTTFDNITYTNPGLNHHVQIITNTRAALKSLGLEVYPNPVRNKLQLRSASEAAVTVSICDLTGKELFRHRFIGSAELPIQHLASGVYLLKFPETNHVVKLVKQE